MSKRLDLDLGIHDVFDLGELGVYHSRFFPGIVFDGLVFEDCREKECGLTFRELVISFRHLRCHLKS